MKSIEKSIEELREELVDQGMDFRNIEDPRIYLSVKFRDNTDSIRVWYDMVNILFGAKGLGASRDKDRHQMVEFIK